MTSDLRLIRPDWPAPANVHAGCTTRCGGVSESPWNSLNLGRHVNDRPGSVEENRRRLAASLGMQTTDFFWLEQVHGTEVSALPVPGTPTADASWAQQRNTVCTILTADCLPVLFCDRNGSRVAAAHAGWRGLCGGVLERVIAAMGCAPQELLAWLGPAIGPEAFEVGAEVRDAFMTCDADAESAFQPSPSRAGHFLADIYQLARRRLSSAGVDEVYGGGWCTVSESHRFYSYRRDGVTGRMASFIWLS